MLGGGRGGQHLKVDPVFKAHYSGAGFVLQDKRRVLMADGDVAFARIVQWQ
jgi:hypothetical protein